MKTRMIAVTALMSLAAGQVDPRLARVDRIVEAAKSGARGELQAQGALGVPYSKGYSGSREIGARGGRSVFDAGSLRSYADCRADRARPASGQWISVAWSCPTNRQAPFLTTIFKFQGQHLLEVRSVPTATWAPSS